MAAPKVVAIIQARMSSTRLPGKVLADLVGRPVLWHLVHRLRKCSELSEIVIATSTDALDDAIAVFAKDAGVALVRGSRDNVLERYGVALRAHSPDIIVGVSGDSPLIDPWAIDEGIRLLRKSDGEFVTGEPGVPSIHEGFSVYTRSAYDTLVAAASNSPIAQEHTVSYFKQIPGSVRMVFSPVEPRHRFEGARLSVDTPADLEFITAVYLHSNAPPGDLETVDLVTLLRVHPELLEINRHVRQKSMQEQTRSALIRCDGSVQVGMGHVVRCIALARSLRDKHSIGVTFAVAESEMALSAIRDAGFPVVHKGKNDSENTWLNQLVAERKPSVVVMDFRTDLEATHVAAWRASGSLIASIDDITDRRCAADLAFYPPAPQLESANWQGFTGSLHSGWDWVMLRPEFQDVIRGSPGRTPSLLLTMGGTDPAGLTLKAVEALAAMPDAFRVSILVGSGFVHREPLKRLMKKSDRDFDLYDAVSVAEVAELFANSDLAIASFGVTAYELAAVGTPAIFLCLTADHAATASALVDAGCAWSLGVHAEVSSSQIQAAVTTALADRAALKVMGDRARRLVDARGADRVAARIAEVLHNR